MPSVLRLAEPLASLSMATDLARGHPPEDALRGCLVATLLADRTGLAPAEASAVYYATLLRFLGCTATSPEYAGVAGGDDVSFRRRGDLVDATDARSVLPFLLGTGGGLGALRRAAVVAGAFRNGARVAAEGARADCEVAERLVRRLGLGDELASALYQGFERWDGRGAPRGLRGPEIAAPARYAAVAVTAVTFLEAGGEGAARQAVRRWSGRALDPELAGVFLAHAGELLEAARVDDAWTAALAAEPRPLREAAEPHLDEVLRCFAHFTDLKSTYLHGHSTGVSALAEAAGRATGLAPADLVTLRRAALLHDLGRAAVPTGIWDKPGPLSTQEWEQVRLHPYHTERTLVRAPALAPLARLAGMHHERLDGQGYHRGAAASEQDRLARLLAAADVYVALGEARPHRPALPPAEAARVLEGEALDREAVAAVLAASGHGGRRPRAWPAELSDREVEVLRLLVRGMTMKEVSGRLFIAPSTVHTHVAHIYEKTGVSTRAGIAVFAMEHDLLR